jgi:hypothetical protein
MKATLEFNLPEETEEFETASNGWRYKSILCELDNHLRSKVKYENLNDKDYEIYEKIREQLWGLIHDENVNLN